MTINIRIIALVIVTAVISLPAAANAPQGTIDADIIAPPPPGSGQIVVYRRGGFFGAAISCAVRESGTLLTHLPPGRFGVINIPAGVHNFEVSSEAVDVMRVDIRPGQTYYGVCAVQVGMFAGRPQLTLVSRETFFAIAPVLKPVKGTILTSGVSDLRSPTPSSPVAASSTLALSANTNATAAPAPTVGTAALPVAGSVPRAIAPGSEWRATTAEATQIDLNGTELMLRSAELNRRIAPASRVAMTPRADTLATASAASLPTTIPVVSSPVVRVVASAAPVTLARDSFSAVDSGRRVASSNDYPPNSAYLPEPAEIFVRTLPPRP